jgi:Fe-S cluster assembly ATP-binding protein
MALLEIDHLTLALNGRTILDDLSLQLWGGYVHAIVGPNGAGKSTLASAVMGLEGYRAAEGRIAFDGEAIDRLSVDERARRGITLGWQEPARFEGLTVERFLRSAAGDLDRDVAADVLRRVGLPPGYLDRAVDKTLSGGERKKVELASIMALRARLVMLDEPDSGIDVESLGRIRDAIGLTWR